MKRVLTRGSYANVASTLALVVALSGTAAYAANTIRSIDIVNGQVKGIDIGKNAVSSRKVKDGSLLPKDFKAGTLPPRAYAQVADVTGPTPTLVAARTKRFTAVTRIGTGSYCLTAPGVNSTKVAAVVSPEWGESAGADLGAIVYANAPGCDPGSFQVMTTNGGILSNSTAFTIVVP